MTTEQARAIGFTAVRHADTKTAPINTPGAPINTGAVK